ncbi:enoyl-CoA hydratase/isomerase family protein [Rhodococcus sp. WAY2]|uniref:enoyl-CoA hydratase/isomerase family protein n=1 Tax=Rhodococcus sp. WAY2 TaxID=2663121 RepID=UPI00131FB0E3|nr:enoyl-CoA hydratase/isomerase family protein [Rhodococcus sp. WAY2]QHE73316.1 Enoyl-CoA hydratase [Rhodococcus sp. WAY2]
MEQPFETIVSWRRGEVGIIELNDPDRLNPTDARTTLAELNEALLDFGRDRVTRAVVLFGRGRAFSAGANLGTHRPARHAQDDEDTPPMRLAYGYAYGQMWETLHNFRKPLIAGVNGYCLGGGWELAQACDFIIAGESAVFGSFEMTVGQTPYAGAAVYLARMVGKHRAMDMILNSRRVPAEEAHALGLCNEIVPVDQTLERAIDLGVELAKKPPVAVSFARHMVNKAMAVSEFYDLERAYGYYLQTMEDTQVARSSRSEEASEPPRYTGR